MGLMYVDVPCGHGFKFGPKKLDDFVLNAVKCCPLLTLNFDPYSTHVIYSLNMLELISPTCSQLTLFV